MSERLLSELFPIFVKKEYLKFQRVSKGPFGEGLEKARTYLKPGEQSPEGANVQTGPQGGKYYDDMGGGGGGKPEFLGGPADKGTPALQDSTDYLKGTADAWAEQMTNDPAFTGSEAEINAAVADLESEIKSQDSDLTNQAAEFDPANSHLDHSNGDIDDDGNWTAPLNEESQKLVDEFRDKLSSGGGAQGTPALQDSKASLQETANTMAEDIKSNPNFTGSEAEINAAVADLEFEITTEDSALRQKHASQGQMEEVHNENSHLDHSEGDIDDNGNWTAPLNEESQQLVDGFRDSLSQGGGAQGGQTSPPEQKEYDGYVGARAVEAEKKANEFIEGVGDHLMDQGTGYDPAEISDAIDGYAASRAYLPGSETYDKLQDAGQRFMAERKDESADYYGEDYALMAKMMQQHNNSPRRDPVILSNKGGNQRLSLQKAGPHKYTSRTMGANGKYVYEYSGGVQGKPDAPEGSSHEQSAAHHHEALRHHGAMAAQSGKRAEKLAAKAPDHPMTRRGQATSQGHLEAQAYHQDQFDQHQAAGAGYDPEEANRQKQGAIYGWD